MNVRIPEPDPELLDVPEDITSAVIEFVMLTRGVELGELGELIRKEAHRQHKRERIVRLKAITEAHLRARPDKEADSYQREVEDERQFGWAAEAAE